MLHARRRRPSCCALLPSHPPLRPSQAHPPRNSTPRTLYAAHPAIIGPNSIEGTPIQRAKCRCNATTDLRTNGAETPNAKLANRRAPHTVPFRLSTPAAYRRHNLLRFPPLPHAICRRIRKSLVSSPLRRYSTHAYTTPSHSPPFIRRGRARWLRRMSLGDGR